MNNVTDFILLLIKLSSEKQSHIFFSEYLSGFCESHLFRDLVILKRY